MPKPKELAPELSIGLVGHVDHGKTTLTKALSGKWTDVHSEELKRGITIKLGYADSTFYKYPNLKEPECYGPLEKFQGKKGIPLRKVSFVDAPGHETLMATMLSGAAIMDSAILLVSATEECPQPQTKEHLMALEIMGIKNIIIVQNKIDLVSKEELEKNYNQIKNFIKGTIAENSPIIPISAQHNINIDFLIQTIQENFKTPERNTKENPLFYVARSFDVNKPGTEIKEINGGVLGGAIKQGVLKKNIEVEIKPGLGFEKEGKQIWEPVKTKIIGLVKGSSNLDEISPGGSSSILTSLDPSIVKSDSLVGNVVGIPNKLPPVWNEFKLKVHLLDRVVGTSEDLKVEPLKINEILVLNVNSASTVGLITNLSKDEITLKLKVPVCCEKTDRIAISRRVGARWRLIGYSEIL